MRRDATDYGDLTGRAQTAAAMSGIYNKPRIGRKSPPDSGSGFPQPLWQENATASIIDAARPST